MANERPRMGAQASSRPAVRSAATDEMLRRALDDARQEGRIPGASSASTSFPNASQEKERVGAPRLNINPVNPQPRGTGNLNAKKPATASSEEQASSDVMPWHEVLIQRFFTPPSPVDPLKKNGRLYFALMFFLVGYAAVIGKLFKVQVLDHDEFSQQAANQYKMQVVLPAKRGVITDRKGVIMAANAYVVKFAVDPKSLQHKEKLAQLFAKTFGKPQSDYLRIFNDTSRRYIVVEKEIPIELASKLDSVKDRGLLREMEPRRHYAFEERASHIIGFTSKDGRGLAGIELLNNKQLAGKSGFAIMQRDGRGTKRPDVDYDQVPPADGDDVTLTIDESIQAATESALKSGVETAKAEAGICMVMNPRTGEILALANYPDFNPNQYSTAQPDALRDRAITDAYEPGSTIKVAVSAMALEENAVKPTDKFDAEGGMWTVDGNAKIRDTHHYGVLTFREALEKSSNVCFAKISDRIERRRFYKYLRDFGFGVLSGIDLPGEIKGYVRKPDRWSVNSKRYMAFGYELTATPLQMASVYATIANMGVMMKPYVIAKRRLADGTIEENHPQEIRRVVSEQTCRTLIGMMRGVVDSGTGTTARIKGVAIAGKTGTAQQLVNGHYSKEHYTSSFTGFFPAENPEYMISVILRSPHNGYYGGAVSAPIWREIAMRILEMNGKLPAEARAPIEKQPRVDEGGPIEIDGTVLNPREVDPRDVPDVKGLSIEAGRSLLASQGFTVIVVGNGADATRQEMTRQESARGVVERTERVGGDTIRIIAARGAAETGSEAKGDKPATTPDFVGMPMARAMKFGAMNGVRTKTTGDGNVRKQFPPAGAPLDKQNPVVTLFGAE